MHRSLAVVALLAASLARGEEATVIRGTVTDADGKPVAGADVGDNWQLGPDCRPYSGLKTGEDGAFELTLRYFRPPIAVLVMDTKREFGAAAVVTADDAAKPVALKLAPLVAVSGEFACASDEVKPERVSMQWQFEKGRIGNLLAPGAKWETRLPPGSWGFWIYHQDLAPFSKNFDVPAGAGPLDLGTLEVTPNGLALLRGKPFPDWTVSDARGVDKSVQPSDYKGKWLLVEFWGFW